MHEQKKGFRSSNVGSPSKKREALLYKKLVLHDWCGGCYAGRRFNGYVGVHGWGRAVALRAREHGAGGVLYDMLRVLGAGARGGR